MKQYILILVAFITLLNSYSVKSESIKTSQNFSDELLANVNPIYQTILKHPYLNGLIDGTLSKDKFRYYLIQNDLYLKKFARSQALLATKSPKDEWTMHFVDNSLYALEGERKEYGELFKKWGVDIEKVKDIQQSPTGLAYSSYEFATIQAGSFAEGLAALLPCYVLYRNIGRDVVKNKDINPLYKEWLSPYADKDFDKLVGSTLIIFNDAVKNLPEDQKQRIKNIFQTSCLFELMFFNAAWNQQTWPKIQDK